MSECKWKQKFIWHAKRYYHKSIITCHVKTNINGFPDLSISFKGPYLFYMETKDINRRGKKTPLTPIQKKVHTMLRNQGLCVAVCYTLEEALEALKGHSKIAQGQYWVYT